MSIKIDGVTYFSMADVIQKAGVSRQTLWRWRHEGKIPPGHRYRNKTVLFTVHEVETIRRFANRIEPIAHPDVEEPRLFDNNHGDR